MTAWLAGWYCRRYRALRAEHRDLQAAYRSMAGAYRHAIEDACPMCAELTRERDDARGELADTRTALAWLEQLVRGTEEETHG